jgi:uncharacterized protein YdhG (YjbR/CyaY superfamily)
MGAGKGQFKTVDEYISLFPDDVQSKMQTLRQVIKEEAPDVQEVIRYKMPTFMLNGAYLVYFAAWKKHISLYPFSTEMEETITEAAPYKMSGKGTIQLPHNQALPLALVRKIVQFRIKETERERK